MFDHLLVPVEKLKNRCTNNVFQAKTTEELSASRELIGQERAMKALKYGLSIRKKGYNIYVRQKVLLACIPPINLISILPLLRKQPVRLWAVFFFIVYFF